MLKASDKTPLAGGRIRHTYKGENVSVNNLIAVQNRLATDICANRFRAQFYLPEDFWNQVVDACHERGLFPEFMRANEDGGVSGILQLATLQLYGGDTVLMYTPDNDILWEFTVGEEHQLISKEQAQALVGKNKGFDLILPYNPYMPEGMEYAPPVLLAQWCDEGYESAKKVTEHIASLPPAQKLELLATWEHMGWTDSRSKMLERGLIAPEELALLPEAV